MSTLQRRRKDREHTHQMSSTSATVLSTTADPLRSTAQVEPEPPHSDIARRAFQRSEERGHEHGNDVGDWLDAERELRQQQRLVRSEGDYDDAA